jgi:hypothetical protein
MNAGFSNLTKLKAELLLAKDAEGTDYDAAVLAIGLGVAAMFESIAGRKFGRVVGEKDVFTADREFWVASRYPLEAVSAVEVRTNYATGWVAQGGEPHNVVEPTGVIFFSGFLGSRGEMARVTFTGGYWWDESEGETGTLPSGAKALPEDLRAAHAMQCRWFWERRSVTERAKAGIPEDKADIGFAASADDLLAPVRQVLATYRRIAQ